VFSFLLLSVFLAIVERTTLTKKNELSYPSQQRPKAADDSRAVFAPRYALRSAKTSAETLVLEANFGEACRRV